VKRLLVVLLVTLVVAGRSFAQWEGPPLACDCGPDAAVRVIGDGACTCVPFRPTATPSPTPTATATPTATRTATPTVTVTPTPTVSATPTATATAQPELGTHTTGDYVADATSGGGLTKTGTEGATLGITPCSDGQIQKFSGGAWGCAADATGGGAGNSFETFNAPNGTDPVADNATDTLNITCPAPLVCTGDSSTDTLTIALGPTPTATPTATPTPTVTVTPTPTVTVTATQTPTPYPTLNGDVDGDMGANDLDELAVESELESVLDLEDLQGSLACADVTGCVENALTSEVDGSTTNELQNIFETIDAPSGTDPVADSTTDTLALAASGIVTITGNATTDTITIGATEVDGSTTNEINTVTADAGGATSGLGITLAGGGIVSTARSGDTVTITGTEVDGSTTNEINTITADSGGATSGLGITLAGGGIVATARSGNTVTITGTETDPQVGTVSTSGRFCTADGSAIQCATAANGGTDITADLEEEAHATEHSAGGGDAITVTNLASSCTDAQTLGGTSGGTGVECQTDDDVPEVGDFGAFDPTACTSGQYMTDITSGAAVCAQVAFSQLSGQLGDGQIAAGAVDLDGNEVEGTLPLAKGGTNNASLTNCPDGQVTSVTGGQLACIPVPQAEIISAFALYVDKAGTDSADCGPINAPCATLTGTDGAHAKILANNDNGFATCSGNQALGCGRCSTTTATDCNENSDCPGGETCTATTSVCTAANAGTCTGPVKQYGIVLGAGRYNETISGGGTGSVPSPGHITYLGAAQNSTMLYHGSADCTVDVTDRASVRFERMSVQHWGDGDAMCSTGGTFGFNVRDASLVHWGAGRDVDFTGRGNATNVFDRITTFGFTANSSQTSIRFEPWGDTCTALPSRACAANADCAVCVGGANVGRLCTVATQATDCPGSTCDATDVCPRNNSSSDFGVMNSFIQAGTREGASGGVVEFQAQGCGTEFNLFLDNNVIQNGASATTDVSGLKTSQITCDQDSPSAQKNRTVVSVRALRVVSNNSVVQWEQPHTAVDVGTGTTVAVAGVLDYDACRRRIAGTLSYADVATGRSRWGGGSYEGTLKCPAPQTHPLTVTTARTPTFATSGGSLPNETYEYKVTGLTEYGETTASTPVSVTTSGCTGSACAVTVIWDRIGRATSYRVYGRQNTDYDRLATVTAPGTLKCHAGSNDGTTCTRSTDCTGNGVCRVHWVDTGAAAEDSSDAPSVDASWVANPIDGECWYDLTTNTKKCRAAGVTHDLTAPTPTPTATFTPSPTLTPTPAVTAAAPIVATGSIQAGTLALSCNAASGSQPGCLGSSDFTAFTNKTRSHATDCTGLTDGKVGQICVDQDDYRVWSCVPSSGDCDTAGEWRRVGAQATYVQDITCDSDMNGTTADTYVTVASLSSWTNTAAGTRLTFDAEMTGASGTLPKTFTCKMRNNAVDVSGGGASRRVTCEGTAAKQCLMHLEHYITTAINGTWDVRCKVDTGTTSTIAACNLSRFTFDAAMINVTDGEIPSTLTRDTEWDSVAKINAATTDNDVATLAGSETLTNKTLTTPTIASFANATHNHSNAAGGGDTLAPATFTVPNSTSAGSTTAGRLHFDTNGGSATVPQVTVGNGSAAVPVRACALVAFGGSNAGTSYFAGSYANTGQDGAFLPVGAGVTISGLSCQTQIEAPNAATYVFTVETAPVSSCAATGGTDGAARLCTWSTGTVTCTITGTSATNEWACVDATHKDTVATSSIWHIKAARTGSWSSGVHHCTVLVCIDEAW